MRDYKSVAETVHTRLLALRNVETLVTLRDFRDVFGHTDEAGRQRVINLIDGFDADGLRQWYKTERLKQLSGLGVRELRQVASQVGVANYNKLPKSLLLSEIVRLRNGSVNADKGLGSQAPDRDAGTNFEGGHRPEALQLSPVACQ